MISSPEAVRSVSMGPPLSTSFVVKSIHCSLAGAADPAVETRRQKDKNIVKFFLLMIPPLKMAVFTIVNQSSRRISEKHHEIRCKTLLKAENRFISPEGEKNSY